MEKRACINRSFLILLFLNCCLMTTLVINAQQIPEIQMKNVTLDNGQTLNVAFVGTGRIQILMLHGFPEGWYGWIEVVQFLNVTQNNLSLVIPDLRGYNLSGRPLEKAAYNISLLVSDILGLIRATGSPVYLVAHDWGGIISWVFASQYPGLLKGLVILNAPHPDVFLKLLQTDPQQQQMSQYILTLERKGAVGNLSANHFALLASFLNASWFVPREEAYYDAWSQPNEVNATVWYYDANFFLASNDSFEGVTSAFPSNITISKNLPTLVLWGMEDQALDSQSNLAGLPQYVPNLRIIEFPLSTHYLQHNVPEAVANAIIQFIANTTNNNGTYY